MKKITQILISFSFAFLTIFGAGTVTELVNPAIEVSAEENKNADSIFNDDIDTSVAESNDEAKSIIGSIKSVANVFAAFVLAISIIMIIFGGLKLTMSNGDARAAESGKMIIIYSGIGIVIAMSAFVLARLFAGFAV